MKKIKKVLLVACLVLVVTGSVVRAISNPTHFVDTQWSLFDATGYNSIEVDIKPEVEESINTDGYYFANTVYFRNYTGSNFGGAYAGIQTYGYDSTAWIGKMALFSVWDVSTGIAESNGKGTTFGGEGTGYSVRIPYTWQVGITYRLKIYIDQDATSGDRLWGASLTNLSTGATTRIGRIYVPVSRGKIYGPVTFHERYLGPTANCNDIKKSQVQFSNMTANGGSVQAPSWNHYYKASTPECPGIAWVKDISNGYMSGISTVAPATEVAATQPVATSSATAQDTAAAITSSKPIAAILEEEIISVPKTELETKTKENKPAPEQALSTPLFIKVILIVGVIIVEIGIVVLVFIIRRRQYLKALNQKLLNDRTDVDIT